MESVLDEVESLFQKISSLPENVRQAAINKIQERLIPSNLSKIKNPKGKFVTTGRRPRITRRTANKNDICTSSSTKSVSINHYADVKSNELNTSKPITRKTSQRLTKLSASKQKNGNQKSEKSSAQKRGKRKVSNEMHVNLHASFKTMHILQAHSVESIKTEEPINVTEVLSTSKEPGACKDISTVPQQRKANLECEICSLWIKGKNNFKRHLKTHNPKHPYACPKCNKAFRQSSNLKVHLKRHNDQRDFACGLCEYRSVTKLDMERHRSIHSDSRDLICEFCAKAFSVKRSLCLHIRTMHRKDEDKFHCSECSFVTHHKNNLRVHVRLRHLGDYYTHVCPVCGARVKLKSAFLEHLRAHTGDRPFGCELCAATFACVGRLNTHRRTIHAPRQFSCTTCGNKFPTKYSLQRHETVHTNDKPHSCPFCSFACNMQGNLTKHIRNMHEQPDFSLRQYKRQQQATVADKRSHDKKKWTQKGQKAFNQYLNTFSKQLGREVTVGELKAQEETRKTQHVAAKEKAKIERINRITSKEHSYFLKPDSPDSSQPGSSEVVLPLPTNIYLEAMAAANLDFTSASLGESISIPADLSEPTGREEFSLHPSVKLVPGTLEYADHFPCSSQGFILTDSGHDDKLSMDPMLSTYSDVLQIPSLGLDALNGPTFIDVPNIFLQLPNGEKVQLSLNFLRDCQLIDTGMVEQPMQATLGEGLGDFLPSVMIVVNEDQETGAPT